MAYDISAATGRGVPALMKDALRALKEETAGRMVETDSLPVKIFKPQPKAPRVRITRVGDEFVVAAPELERIRGGAGVGPGDLRWQLNYQFQKLGIDKALEKAGAKTGDKIRCGELTWEWVPSGRKK